MTIAEAIAEAKADLHSVQNKTLPLIKEQERSHRKNRHGGDIVGRRAYTSPGKNNWLCVTTTNKKHTLQNFLMYIHAKDGFFALQPSYEGLSFLFTPHFLMRYRERSGHVVRPPPSRTSPLSSTATLPQPPCAPARNTKASRPSSVPCRMAMC